MGSEKKSPAYLSHTCVSWRHLPPFYGQNKSREVSTQVNLLCHSGERGDGFGTQNGCEEWVSNNLFILGLLFLEESGWSTTSSKDDRVVSSRVFSNDRNGCD